MSQCECGCGKEVKNRFIHGHNNRGKKGWNWKSGRTSHKDGYIQIYKPGHPNCDNKGYVMEHRLVMEEYLGRYLDPIESIHHINKIKSDNGIENLMLFQSLSGHMKYEYLNGELWTEERKQKLGITVKQLWTKERKMKYTQLAKQNQFWKYRKNLLEI
jgi:hypothetical protein